ncbi:MAG: N-acetyl-gamma-glutamyl-phosphate reductase [Promicromonosporaceae bacterium]|nr:N-acetyl-gamma-glutamyl-phosphate reductase [Promicromonosporaceae bacterium]
MKKVKVYIDGEAGTTGLKIRERFKEKENTEILTIDEALRKDSAERKKLLNAADFVFLCLPDNAAREAVSLIENPQVRVIDASTAHRTHPDWTYGFPELSGEHLKAVRNSKRVSVPGCYASGFVALVYPLVKAGVIPADFSVTCFGISGYSGAGKAAITEYENEERNPELNSARLYALSQEHKHMPEMQKHSGLNSPPMFNPMIDDFYRGMIICIPLQTRMLPKKHTAVEIIEIYKAHYPESGEQSGPEKVRVKVQEKYESGFLAANTLSNCDDMELFAFADSESERILLTARLDNLGKGASGAAVQCFDLMRSGYKK